MDHTNVVNPPLIIAPDNKLLIDVFNIPQLHVMTGVLAKLVEAAEKSFPSGKTFIDGFLSENNIHKTEYHGTHSFEGNHARDLMLCSQKLRDAAVKKLSPFVRPKTLAIVDTIEAFSEVVTACFSIKINGDYKSKIRTFSLLYRRLNISVPPKVKVLLLTLTLTL